MSTRLHIQLPKELLRYVDERTNDKDVYSTPSEYICDLIRKDMETRSQTQEREIAEALLKARKTPVTPFNENSIEIELNRLKEKTYVKKIKLIFP